MHRFWNSVTRPLLDTIEVTSMVEIGVEDGHHTTLLLPYAKEHGATLHCIDPVEPAALANWKETFSETLRFHTALSVQALPTIQLYDVVFIDGDHNWYTVHRELMEIDRRAKSMHDFPIVLLHDIGWPYGRRDQYCDPQNIPAAERQPYAVEGVHKDWERLDANGLNAQYAHAERMGGPRNGVLTAIEHFLKQSTEALSFVQINGLHGLGILVSQKRLQENATLAEFLRTLAATPALNAHIGSMEDDRIHGMLREEHLQKQMTDVTSQQVSLLENIGEMTRHQYALEQEHKQLTLALGASQKTSEQLKSEVSHVKTELQAARQQRMHDAEHIAALSQYFTQLERKKDALEREYKLLEAQNHRLMQRVEQIEQEKEVLRRERQSLQLSDAKHQQHIREMKHHIATMEEEHARFAEDARAHARTAEQLTESLMSERAEVEALQNRIRGLEEKMESERLRLVREARDMEERWKHLQRTRSWRLTRPLRALDALQRRVLDTVGYGVIALCRLLWTVTGQPMPTFTRWVRHRLLAKRWPVKEESAQRNGFIKTENMNKKIIHTSRMSDVSVIVASRNYGRFLSECFASILGQTVRPKEIIYVDDGSTDDSVAVASTFKDVRVIALPHRSAPAARNSGVKASTGSILLHVDGDDMLPPDFLETHLHTLLAHPHALFAYGPAQAFGMHTTLWDAPEWDRDALWLQNFVNTSAIVHKNAFEKVGGWREDLETMWDWDVWLRLSALGDGVRSPATILYRQHAQSWGHTHELAQSERDLGSLMGSVRRGILGTSICTVYSGRLPKLFPLWLESLVASIELQSGGPKPDLIMLDHSEHGVLGTMKPQIQKYASSFRSIQIIPFREKLTWNTEIERRDAVANFLAKAYNKLLSLSTAEVVWFLEDDMVVPVHAYNKLLTSLTDGVRPKAAVSALYKNRHIDEYVAHTLDKNGNPLSVQANMSDMQRIDLAGTGCLMVFRPVARHPFRSHWKGRVPAHDWAWSEDLRATGQEVWLNRSVVCKHYSTADTYV